MNALLAAFLAVTAVTSAEKGNLHDDERVVTSVDESKLVHWGEDAVGKSFRVTGGYGSGASSTGGVELVGSTLKVSGSAVYPGVIDMSPKVGGSSVGAFQKFGGGAGLYFYGADDMNLPGHYGLGAGWESLDQRIRRLAPAFSEADPVFAEWSRTNTLVKAETDPRFTRWAETNTFVKTESDPAFTGWIGDELEGTNVFRSKTDLVVYDGTPQSPTEDRLATRRWVMDNASPADYSNVSNAAVNARNITNLIVYAVGVLADWHSSSIGLENPLRWNEANGRWEDVLDHGRFWLRYDGGGQWTVHIPDGEGVEFKYFGLESALELKGSFGRFWRDKIYEDPKPTDDRLATLADLKAEVTAYHDDTKADLQFGKLAVSQVPDLVYLEGGSEWAMGAFSADKISVSSWDELYASKTERLTDYLSLGRWNHGVDKFIQANAFDPVVEVVEDVSNRVLNASVYVGRGATANSNDGTAIGHSANAGGNAFAAGVSADARENNSVAIGRQSVSTNESAVALGARSRSHGPNTFSVASPVGNWYAGDTPFLDAIRLRYVETNVTEVVTNALPRSGGDSVAEVVTNVFTALVPDGTGVTVAYSDERSLAKMLTDAATNETQDCECIRTNMCNLVHDDVVKTVNDVKRKFWDETLEVEWTFVASGGEFMMVATTNVNTEVLH